MNGAIFNDNLILTQRYCAMQMLNVPDSIAETLRSIHSEYEGKPVWEFEKQKVSYNIDGKPFTFVKWNFDPFKYDLLPKLF